MRTSNRKLFYIIGAILFALITIIGPILYTRLNSGEFVFSDDIPAVSMGSIILSDNISFEPTSPRLNADSVVDEISIAYDSIKLDEILQSEGQFIDPDQRYLAYSFYIKNTGIETSIIDYHMRISEVYDHMDEYVRILIIEDDDIYHMYQKADLPDVDNNMPNYNQLPSGIDFMTDTIVFRNTFTEFKPNDIKSFRVIIWLEEQDPDIVENDQIGKFETQLNFMIRDGYPIGNNDTHLLSSEDENIWIPISTINNVDLGIAYEVDDNS